MVKRLGIHTVIMLTALFTAVPVWAAQRQLALVGGMLLDGTDAPPVHHAAILIEGNRIVAAGPANTVRIQDVNAAGTAAVTTTFGYDTNGNQTSIAAPLARNAGNAYDEFNRLKQITDPASGVTQFGYDANDNLTSVTDPRSLHTTYTYTGFGDLKTQVSPDTGTTTNTYDSGGNLSTSTDARGAVSTYTYDALNRVTSVAYALGGTTDREHVAWG